MIPSSEVLLHLGTQDGEGELRGGVARGEEFPDQGLIYLQVVLPCRTRDLGVINAVTGFSNRETGLLGRKRGAALTDAGTG